MFDLADAEAAVAGRPATLEQGVIAAAALLSAAAMPVIAGLRTDAAGAVAAALLARRLGAVLDHAESAASLNDLQVMRVAGWTVTTPVQARALADLVLIVGDLPPDFLALLALDRPPSLDVKRRPRQVLRLAAGEGVTERLGLLRALVRRRTVAAPDDLVAIGRMLREARYGVVAWSGAQLPPLAVEMLCGLIDDLNTTTRFAGLPLPAPGNAAGVAHALVAETGFPFRTAFRDGVASHDPWRYDAARMVASGEADAALWLDALGEGAPAWQSRVKLVALAPPDVRFTAAPDVVLAVGRPGVDHAAALFHPAACTPLAVLPAVPKSRPTAADVLGRILAVLPSC